MSRSSSDAAASTAETTRSDRERLRLTFAADADRYDRMRPGYPSQLFDDLAELACIGPGCRVLEIGVGTGQATLPVAARGVFRKQAPIPCWVTVSGELFADPFGAIWRSPDGREATVQTMPPHELKYQLPILSAPALVDDVGPEALDDRALEAIRWRP